MGVNYFQAFYMSEVKLELNQLTFQKSCKGNSMKKELSFESTVLEQL
jgi:hypothetical protein